MTIKEILQQLTNITIDLEEYSDEINDIECKESAFIHKELELLITHLCTISEYMAKKSAKLEKLKPKYD